MTAQTQLSFYSIGNGDGGATIKDEHGGYVASVQWKCHAPLLAAAPDLLAALDDLYEQWGEARDDFGDRHCLDCRAIGDPDDEIPMPHGEGCSFARALTIIKQATGS